MLPHPPYVADPEDFAAVAGRVPASTIARPDGDSEHPWPRKWRRERGIDDLGPGATARARLAYWGMVRRLDGLIGEVLDALEASGLAEDTLLIYASDHGDHLGERGLFWKHTFYDESARVPLMMRWPGMLPPGRRSGVTGLIDLGATMLDAAVGEWAGGGDSLLSLAHDPDAPWRDEVVSEYCTGIANPWSSPEPTMNRMARRGRYKLCYYHGLPPTLFDMQADPDELMDIAGDPAHAAVRDVLLARVLADWNPDEIASRLAVRERDAALLTEWARRTAPEETHRWSMPEGKRPSLAGTGD